MTPFLLLLGAAVLTGIDLYLSHRRMQKYGPRAELNPIVQQVAEDFGLKAATATATALNALILTLATWLDTHILALLCGAKLGLAAMQFKSLHLELMVDRLLEGLKQKPS